MKKRRHLAGLIAIACLVWAGPALADSVADWNAITAQTVLATVPPRPVPIIFLDFAVVHVATHDAVQAFRHEYDPYAVAIPGATGSIDAAVAKAAHDVLVNRYPAQAAALDSTYAAYLAAHGIAPGDAGVAIGAQAAAAIIALRSTDGSFPNPPPPPFTGSTDIGLWRPTPSFIPTAPPPSNSPMAIPWLATVTPFSLTGPSQFRPEPPPGVTDQKYTKDYKEIKRLGSDVNSERTQEQTDIALFWNLNYGIQWNIAVRDVVTAHVADISDSARLFALTNMAAFDAAISVWDCKVTFPRWRPVTAITEGDNDGNPKTEGDVNWRPLINTPNYPDPCSGANGVSAATTKVLGLVLNDNTTFQMTSNNPLAIPPTRTYTRFSDASRDVRDARVWQGIHFRFADVTGRKMGLKVGKWTVKHTLRRINGDDDDYGDDDEDDD